MTLVLWSGGCDSTLALAGLLRIQYHDNKNHNIIDKDMVSAISISHCNVPANNENKIARDKIKKHFYKMGWHFEHHEVVIECQSNLKRENQGLTQPLIWVPTATLYLKAEEDLCCGYIAGDCIWHYIDKLHNMFNNAQCITGNTGKLIFPLEWTSKSEVIRLIKEWKLYSKVWWCESPIRKDNKPSTPCKKCVPCKTHQVAKFALENELC